MPAKVKEPTTNYARHVGEYVWKEVSDTQGKRRKRRVPVVEATGELVFFGHTSPRFDNPEHWAFYRMPDDVEPFDFVGRIIGETPVDIEDIN